MDDSARQRLIDIISWGKLLVSEKTSDDQPLSLVLHTPNPEAKARSAIIYELEYANAVSNGALNSEAMIEHCIVRGLWNPETDVQIAGIKEDLRKLRKGLLDYLFQKDKLERVRSTIRSAEKALIERLMSRYELTKTSAEACAIIAQQRSIISKITYHDNGELYWPTDKAFDDERDTSLIDRLVLLFYDHTRISASEIRLLARTSPWRTLWTSINNKDQLFGISSKEWSEPQKNLVYWSHIYDIVHESMERPIEMVIEDDDLLDSWLIRQADRLEQRCKESTIKPPTTGKHPQKPGRQEQFVMTDPEGAKMIYDLNDPITRARIKAKQQNVKKHGSIKEQDMPDSQVEIRQLAVQQARKHGKRKG